MVSYENCCHKILFCKFGLFIIEKHNFSIIYCSFCCFLSSLALSLFSFYGFWACAYTAACVSPNGSGRINKLYAYGKMLF